jgi:HlyD family secretion protein
MKKMLSRSVVVVIIAALASVIVLAVRPQPVPVEAVPADVGLLEQKVVQDGHARIRERHTISAPVAGTLARIELHEGDPVEPATVLARLLPLQSPLLDPRAREVAGQRVASAGDAHRQALATLERARDAAEVSQQDLARTRELVAREAAPRTQLEAAQASERMRLSEVESAQFAERVAAHGVDEARAALETFSPHLHGAEQLVITSPVHGTVLHVLQRSEGVVAAGTPLIEVGDPQALELVVDVLSQDAARIRPGMPARALHWGGDAPLLASVRRVEPAAFTRTSALGVDEQRVNVLLDLDSPPEQWRSLGDGFAVEVEITLWTRPDALQVPTSALFRSGEGWAVFAVENGSARPLALELGRRGPLQTEVLSGVRPGERVIVHPGASVRAGSAVVAR